MEAKDKDGTLIQLGKTVLLRMQVTGITFHRNGEASLELVPATDEVLLDVIDDVPASAVYLEK